MRVALVHDYLNQYGGAERVLEEMHALWPDAPVYVAIHDPARMPATYRGWDIRASALNLIPFANRKHQALLPLLPHAFEGMDLSDYDLVVSSSSGFAHGVLTGPQQAHLCYCHSPPRFLWDYHAYARRERMGGVLRALVSPHLARLRVWDRVSAERADAWVATSGVVRDRIAKYYGKPSEILPPPVPVSRFEVGDGRGGYILMLMRLVGWKRPDLVVEACNRLGLPLVVAGDGREMPRLRAMAGPTVRFVGRVGNEEMRDLYRDCRVFVLPAEEDFGITPLEAMASGRPVLALGRGGALDTVKPGVTGAFFAEQTTECLVEALSAFDERAYDPAIIRRHAETYDSAHFRRRLHDLAEGALKARRLPPVLSANAAGDAGVPARPRTAAA